MESPRGDLGLQPAPTRALKHPIGAGLFPVLCLCSTDMLALYRASASLRQHHVATSLIPHDKIIIPCKGA